ncbi:MAG: hypothetical protein AAGI68_12075, partial [Planctomycetota bacterium]
IGNNSGKSQGVFTAMLTDFVAEENFFYRNGWHPDVAEAVRNKFNHNLYMAENNEPATVRRNIFVSPGSHGAQLRGGGQFDDNLILDAPIGAFVRTNPSAMRGNTVLLSPKTPDERANDGIGLQAFNLPSVEMTGNLVGHLANGSDGHPYEVRDRVGTGVFANNVASRWPGESRIGDSVEVRNNRLELNTNLDIDDRFDPDDWPLIQANQSRGMGEWDPDLHSPDPTHARLRALLETR